MSQNSSTFDAGFNVVTPNYTLLDSRYFRITERLGELSGSSTPLNAVSASRSIFGYSVTSHYLTDCIIRSSGSGCVLRFNTTTASIGTPANWLGAMVFDTDVGKTYMASSSQWVQLIDSKGGTFEGNVKISGSYNFTVTSSIGSKIGIANASNLLFEISASNTEANIIQQNSLYFKTPTTTLGVINSDGTINFSSGSFVLGKESTSNNVINGNLRVTNTLSASSISCSGDIIAFSTSDSRLKDNIQPMTDNLKKLDLINAYSFDWKPESNRQGADLGVLAQEIELILPEAVVTRDTGYKAVDYQKLIPFLLGCIKELKQRIDEK